VIVANIQSLRELSLLFWSNLEIYVFWGFQTRKRAQVTHDPRA
jgi:hypothetical protein